MSKITAFIAIPAIAETVSAQTMPAEYDGALKVLGKQGISKRMVEGQHTQE
jgi:hypothetical protein